MTSETPGESFDLIICRNVLIYFNGELQHQVLHRLEKCLLKNGHLMLGPRECLTFYQPFPPFWELSQESRVFKKKRLIRYRQK
ncbi:MAG: CheR family methyltransferase [Owenweeksia sp.]|nr:CheR family methyltransferase [Owenweeksia sp.]